MALTMVHLLVADRWTQGHPEYRESPEFFYGVISPDAIHVRDGGDKSHKDEIHLHNWRSPHPDEVIAYWRQCDEPFDIGYGVHVLTDAQWVPRYKSLLPGILREDGRLNTDIYYNDCFITDFQLYNTDSRLRHLTELLATARTPEAHPLLTAYEFSRWRETVLEAYRGACKYGNPVRFIDEAYVREFAGDAIPLIDRVFEALRAPEGD